MKKFLINRISLKSLWKRGGALFVIVELSFIVLAIIVWNIFIPIIREERISKLQIEIEKSTLQIDQTLASWNTSLHKSLMHNIGNLQRRQNIDTLCKDAFYSFSTLIAATIQFRDDTATYYYCPSATENETPKFNYKKETFNLPVCQNNVADLAVIHGIKDSVAMVISFGIPLSGRDSADALITLYSNPKRLSNSLFKKIPVYIESSAFFIDTYNEYILISDTIENNTDMMPYFRQNYGDAVADFIRKNGHSASCKKLIFDDKVCFVAAMTSVPRAVCIIVPLAVFTSEISELSSLFILLSIIFAFIISLVCIKHIIHQTRKDALRLVGECEMQLASNVQKSMLSKPICDVPTIDLSSRFISAKAVGGDLYYFYEHNGYVYFCIGDVSSKGVPAAMYMSRSLSSFRNAIRYSISSSDIAEQMNQELCLDNDQMMFVTVFIGVLKIKTGELSYCNAGHEKPLIWRGDDNEKPYFLNSDKNMPMGINSNWRFVENTISLPVGTMLTLYTDGVTEAMNKNREMYGSNRLYSLFCKECSHSAESMTHELVSSVTEFTKQTEQSDDIAILTICIKSFDETFAFSLDIESLRQLQALFLKLEHMLEVDKRFLYDMRTAVDEMITNVIKHGFVNNDVPADITLRVVVENQQIRFILRDNGIAFNPLEYQPAERNMSKEDFTIGGLGISMMRSVFLDVEYERDNGYNVLTMTQNI